jgi:DNA-directed RNA polymerase specialized sigma subunit
MTKLSYYVIRVTINKAVNEVLLYATSKLEVERICKQLNYTVISILDLAFSEVKMNFTDKQIQEARKLSKENWHRKINIQKHYLTPRLIAI